MNITNTNGRLLDIFLETTSIDGISANERKIADYILTFLFKLGLSPKEDNIADKAFGNAGNIVCSVGSGKEFVLLAHMDTIKPTDNLKAVVLNDRIKSDGTTILGADNRAGISCLLYAIEKLTTQKIPSNNFTLVFTVQEETTLNGSRLLKLDDSIKMGFVFDSHLPPGNFIYESTGSIGFSAKVIGKAAHSGLAPEKGIDSIKIASDAISKIKLGRIDFETTANIGIIKGGEATNIVPETTYVEGEVRSFNKTKVESKITEIKNQFEFSANQFGGWVEFNSFWNFRPYKVSEDSLTIKTIEKTMRKIGLNAQPSTSFGGSDANSLNEKGIDTINLGIGAENPHSTDEYILLKDLEKTAELALELMKK